MSAATVANLRAIVRETKDAGARRAAAAMLAAAGFNPYGDPAPPVRP